MYGIVLPGPHVDGGVPIIKGGDVAADRLDPKKLSRTSPEIESNYERSRLAPGDIVYSIRGSIGEAECVPSQLENANLTQDAARISPRSTVHNQWLLHCVQSKPVFAQLEAGAVGATIRGINIKDLKRAKIPVPPPFEQEELAEHLGAQTRGLDLLVQQVEKQNNILAERRSALISAAVTGKIDVRDWTPPALSTEAEHEGVGAVT
nr:MULTISPECIES: restriction endonuclease subunit S [Halorhodospira]